MGWVLSPPFIASSSQPSALAGEGSGVWSDARAFSGFSGKEHISCADDVEHPFPPHSSLSALEAVALEVTPSM